MCQSQVSLEPEERAEVVSCLLALEAELQDALHEVQWMRHSVTIGRISIPSSPPSPEMMVSPDKPQS